MPDEVRPGEEGARTASLSFGVPQQEVSGLETRVPAVLARSIRLSARQKV